MSNGEGWLLRPVERGYCKYESLKDGTLDMLDIAIMNESIDVHDENKIRFSEFMSHNKPG